MARSHRVRRPLLALLGLLVALAVGYLVRGSDDGGHRSPSPTTTVNGAVGSARPTSSTHSADEGGGTSLSTLPPQVAQTVHLIESGGPYPYSRDGVVFGNFERRLPSEPRGFYREYTVPTPGSRDRGARRVVAGRDGRFWYTADHYDSFVMLDVR